MLCTVLLVLLILLCYWILHSFSVVGVVRWSYIGVSFRWLLHKVQHQGSILEFLMSYLIFSFRWCGLCIYVEYFFRVKAICFFFWIFNQHNIHTYAARMKEARIMKPARLLFCVNDKNPRWIAISSQILTACMSYWIKRKRYFKMFPCDNMKYM